MNYNCIVILGTTASGKTELACALANQIDGEIISADSRQVYKHLDIGTGKDLCEYEIMDKKIPYHLIDIIEPVEQYYLHQFVEDLQKCFADIISRNKMPIICGGTGLYLDALHKDFSLTQIKEDLELRNRLEQLSKEILIEKLKAYPQVFWQHVDLKSKKRIVRGIEIADYKLQIADLTHNIQPTISKSYNPIYFGISNSIDERKRKISERLNTRLNSGLIEEVEGLLKSGITHNRLQKFGLEYKFVSQFLSSELNREELFTKLQTAIFQFAKRQMTWFRKMEKEGIKINWLDANKNIGEKLREICEQLNENK